MMLKSMINSPMLTTTGVTVACLSMLNSFFELFNPVLTGIFYVASITWLVIQMYYKIKYRKK